jgi:hypothetical protein
VLIKGATYRLNKDNYKMFKTKVNCVQTYAKDWIAIADGLAITYLRLGKRWYGSVN